MLAKPELCSAHDSVKVADCEYLSTDVQTSSTPSYKVIKAGELMEELWVTGEEKNVNTYPLIEDDLQCMKRRFREYI